LFFFFWFGHVYIDEFEFDIVVFQVLLGHFAPDACTESVDNDLVVVLFTLDFRKRHYVHGLCLAPGLILSF
jgi:hypothetical protein